MSNTARWRLGCNPTAADCVFVVTNRGDITRQLRFDCIKHFGGFLVTPTQKFGRLKFEGVDAVGEPPSRVGALEEG